jgi:putative Holliday junction resolvase
MNHILAIDYGEKRIGLAVCSTEAFLPRPYRTLPNDNKLIDELKEIVANEEVIQVIVGLPRSLDGRETAQTARCRAFADSLGRLDFPVVLQDEAATSAQARKELDARGKPYAKGAIDALAATYILEDYLIGAGVIR